MPCQALFPETRYAQRHLLRLYLTLEELARRQHV